MLRHTVEDGTILRSESRFKSMSDGYRLACQPDDSLPHTVAQRLAPAPRQALEQVAHTLRPLDARSNLDELGSSQRRPSG
jgi:hypothetical protein